MKSARIGINRTLGLAGLVASLAVSTAGAQESDVRKLMGENFGGLQTILWALIRADYAAVPAQVDIIASHADELTRMVPSNAEAHRDQFLSYAMNLRGHAQDVKTISQALMKHDAERTVPGPDYLREALAAHYGGMVTTCVACHNRFRPAPPE